MAKKKTSKKKVAKKNLPAKGRATTDLAKFDYGDDAGAGYENQTRDDIAMPFMLVLQALSPAVSKEEVKGAKPGLLMNSVTQELMDECMFLPATTEHCFIEWVPRDAGGGFVAKHEIHSPVVAKAKAEAEEFNKLQVGDNDLVETYSIYVVLVDDTDVVGYAVISCESTKIKQYKNFNTRLQQFMLKLPSGQKVKPPMWAHLSRMATMRQEKKGHVWYVPVMGPADGGDLPDNLLTQDDPRYQAGAELRELVQSGTATAAYDTADRTEGGKDEDEDLPF